MILYYSTKLIQIFAIVSKSYMIVYSHYTEKYILNDINSHLCDPDKLKIA